YARYRDWVVALAWRFTGDRDAALDVAQDTFIYLLKKFPGFTLTAQFKTFFYPVVKHLALNARAKSQRYSGVPTGAGGDDPSIALDQLPAPDATSNPAGATSGGGGGGEGDLAIVMASLSEEHRETVLLRFVEGLN